MDSLFRWTIYPTSKMGYEILAKSVIETPKAIGEDKFNWMICFNGNDNVAFSIIQDIAKIARVKIKVLKQKREDCPIKMQYAYCGMWKVCPPRLTNGHEIICDNDIVLTRKCPKIDQFLESNTTLLLEDPVRYYGQLNHLHGKGEQWNSGFMGIPPNYDFGKDIKLNWEQYSNVKIGYPEEQSLLTKTLRRQDSIIINKNEIIEIHADVNYQINGNEYGFHMVQSNREHHMFASQFIK